MRISNCTFYPVESKVFSEGKSLIPISVWSLECCIKSCPLLESILVSITSNLFVNMEYKWTKLKNKSILIPTHTLVVSCRNNYSYESKLWLQLDISLLNTVSLKKETLLYFECIYKIFSKSNLFPFSRLKEVESNL